MRNSGAAALALREQERLVIHRPMQNVQNIDAPNTDAIED